MRNVILLAVACCLVSCGKADVVPSFRCLNYNTIMIDTVEPIEPEVDIIDGRTIWSGRTDALTFSASFNGTGVGSEVSGAFLQIGPDGYDFVYGSETVSEVFIYDTYSTLCFAALFARSDEAPINISITLKKYN